MFKKMLLTALVCASTIATAQIQLALDITITHEEVSRQIQPVILVDEDVPASIEFSSEHEKAHQRHSPAGCVFLLDLWPFISGHGNPPAWLSHDDGDGRDGGCSASN